MDGAKSVFPKTNTKAMVRTYIERSAHGLRIDSLINPQIIPLIVVPPFLETNKLLKQLAQHYIRLIVECSEECFECLPLETRESTRSSLFRLVLILQLCQ